MAQITKEQAIQSILFVISDRNDIRGDPRALFDRPEEVAEICTRGFEPENN